MTGDASLRGKHLVDECCASCGGHEAGGHCAQCMAHGHTKATCTAAGVCQCDYPAPCVRCMVADGKTPFTKAECESYGVDCSEDCTTTHGIATRRALQGGSGGGGTQVTSNTASAGENDCFAQ